MRWTRVASRGAALCALSVAVCLGACVHQSPSPAQPQSAAESASLSRDNSAPAAPARAGPTSSRAAQQPAAASKSDAAVAPSGQGQVIDVAAFMRDHFIIAAWARDAVVEGDLASLREPLRQLADYRYPGVIPGGWMQYLSRLQAAARLTSEAEQLTTAAVGVATMARICGECHVQHRVSLTVDFRLPSSDPEPEVETLSSRMYRHQWASSRLWEGITVPSDEAWQAGANALAEIADSAPTANMQLTPQVLALLKQVRLSGVEALAASTLEQRATAYARVLSLCSGCHAQRRPTSP